MYKVRIVFSKLGYAKYVSHLDLMRMFQRAFRKAELDISFSQGFNPHPKMSISHPLPVGVTGLNEYMDIVVDSQPNYEKIKDSLNLVLPVDIKITNVCEATEPLNLLVISEYTVELTLKNSIPDFNEYLEALKDKSDIVVAKKTKKGISNVDIKPDIKLFEVVENNDKYYKFHMLLSTGEKSNLKASSVLDAFKKYIPNFEIEYCLINREGLYKENMTKISL